MFCFVFITRLIPVVDLHITIFNEATASVDNSELRLSKDYRLRQHKARRSAGAGAGGSHATNASGQPFLSSCLISLTSPVMIDEMTNTQHKYLKQVTKIHFFSS